MFSHRLQNSSSRVGFWIPVTTKRPCKRSQDFPTGQPEGLFCPIWQQKTESASRKYTFKRHWGDVSERGVFALATHIKTYLSLYRALSFVEGIVAHRPIACGHQASVIEVHDTGNGSPGGIRRDRGTSLVPVRQERLVCLYYLNRLAGI